MGINRVIKFLVTEVVFWAIVLMTSYVTGYQFDLFSNFATLIVVSLLLGILPYSGQIKIRQAERKRQVKTRWHKGREAVGSQTTK